MIIEQAFDRSLEASTQERLKLQTFVLMGAAEAGGGELWMPKVLHEPRFSQPGSGLYGMISNNQPDTSSGSSANSSTVANTARVLWRSTSSLGLDLDGNMPEKTNTQQFGRTQAGLFYFSFPVIWETEDGRETPFLFSTLETASSYEAEISSFRFYLWGGLGLLGILLLLAQDLVLRWGLLPLKDMASDLKDIEQGNSDKLQGHYPDEVYAITTNLNLLLDDERRQRERYRNTLADLAHSLKTPLAVLRNQTTDSAPSELNSQQLTEQVDRMDQIISHQLGRASASSAHNLLKPVNIRTCAERIGNALKKVYQDKFLGFEVVTDNETQIPFKGDERDMMEMLGNLIDNGFKYGQGKVRVTLSSTTSELIICVENNGDGISNNLHDAILQRGTRADSLQPGQGIGLSVVKDILSGYQGQLEVSQSELGGAAFRLILPRL